MAAPQIVLPPAAAYYLCSRFDLMLHPLLRVGWMPAEATEQQQRQALDRGRQQLAQQGLLQHEDLDPFLEDAIHLLARPPLAVGLAVHSREGESYNAVFVEYGRATIQAYQADGEQATELQNILITRQEYGGPVGNAANLVGQLTPARSASVSVPADYFDQASNRARGGNSLITAFTSSGIRSNDAKTLAEAYGSKRLRDGGFSVRAYDQKIRKTNKHPVKLQFMTTENGSYLVQRKPSGDGREWLNLVPADNRRLTAALNEMVQALRSVPAYR